MLDSIPKQRDRVEYIVVSLLPSIWQTLLIIFWMHDYRVRKG